MAYETVILERKDNIAILTLNRPEAMNALNSRINGEFNDAIEEAGKDDAIAVLVITGAGRAFCAGRDLKEISTDINVLVGGPGSIFDKLRWLDKPTIAAVNGFAVTGGLELVLNCDIVIASETARFADTHARVGLVPGGGLSQFLPRLVGAKKAKELSFSGNFFSAQEALQWGMINRVVPAAELMATAEALARDIAGCDQNVVRKMKRLIDRGEGLAIEDALAIEKGENLRHKMTMTGEDVGRRRESVMDRGRSQSG